jgi:hypothetical protein
MPAVFDDVRDKAIALVPVRFPEVAKNLNAGEKQLRPASAKPKVIVPGVDGCSIPQDFDDGEPVVDIFLK